MSRPLSARALLALGVLALTGLSACSSLNPFAAPPPNRPTELVDIKPTLAVRSLWSAAVGAGDNALFSPAIAAGSVYAAAADGTVARFALGTGGQTWRVKAADRLSAGVGADGNLVVVASADGEVVALGADGAPRWKTPINTEILSAPAVGDGWVVVRTSDNRLIGLDAATGARRWTYQRPNPPLVLRGATGMLISNGVLFAGFPGGRLAALTVANGSVRWDVSVAAPRGSTELERIADIVGRPVLVGREVCVASFQGRAGCFDAANGNPAWTREASSGNGIAVDARYAFYTDDQGVVHALTRTGGASVWRNDSLKFRQGSAPASVGRAVVVGDYRGVLHWLSREDGTFLARVNTDGSAINAQPLSFDAGAVPAVLLQTQSGVLFAFASD